MTLFWSKVDKWPNKHGVQNGSDCYPSPLSFKQTGSPWSQASKSTPSSFHIHPPSTNIMQQTKLLLASNPKLALNVAADWPPDECMAIISPSMSHKRQPSWKGCHPPSGWGYPLSSQGFRPLISLPFFLIVWLLQTLGHVFGVSRTVPALHHRLHLVCEPYISGVSLIGYSIYWQRASSVIIAASMAVPFPIYYNQQPRISDMHLIGDCHWKGVMNDCRGISHLNPAFCGYGDNEILTNCDRKMDWCLHIVPESLGTFCQ